VRIKKNSSENASSTGTVRHITTGALGIEDGGPTMAGAAVPTVTVAVTGVTPSLGVTDAGELLHIACVGAPVQARATAWLNPPAGVTVTVKVPLLP
jgi:hypothetical protein